MRPTAEDERLFLLDQAIQFRSGLLDDDVAFSWVDVSGDPSERWEFVCAGETVPKATSGVFELTVLQCMYERVRGGARSVERKTTTALTSTDSSRSSKRATRRQTRPSSRR